MVTLSFLVTGDFLCAPSSVLLNHVWPRGQEGNPSPSTECGQIFQVCHRPTLVFSSQHKMEPGVTKR